MAEKNKSGINSGKKPFVADKSKTKIFDQKMQGDYTLSAKPKGTTPNLRKQQTK